MKFSIITVNYNNPEGLERTIKSVISQSFNDYEYIIVDGNSVKGDQDVIRKYDKEITKWVSENDSGIYNAMNKGVTMASGDYCLFMNSGDELYSSNMLEEVAKQGISGDFVQGIIVRPGRKEKFVYPPHVSDLTLGWYIWGRNNYHQASFIKRTLLLEHSYDESLRIAADLKFNVEVLIKCECSFQPIMVPIAKYEYGGLSSKNSHAEETRRIFCDLFGDRIVNDYYDLAYVKRFPINRIMPLLKRIHNMRLFEKIRKNNNR